MQRLRAPELSRRAGGVHRCTLPVSPVAAPRPRPAHSGAAARATTAMAQPAPHDEGAEVARQAQHAEAGEEQQPYAEALEGLEQVQVPQEPEYVEIEVTTETEIVEEVPPFQARQAVQQAHSYLTGTSQGQLISAGVGVVGLALAAVYAYRKWQEHNTAEARKTRQLRRNQRLVNELNKYLPDKRFKLTDKIVKGLKNSTGYEPKEVFRKYMWYVLNERKFSQEAVEDLLVLKECAGMSDMDVADAIAERAQRVYDKYGTLILNPEGFTSVGQKRKEACRALCQKILFLAECNALVQKGSEAASKLNLRVIFGVSEEDMNKMRIRNIQDLTKSIDEADKLSDDETEEAAAEDQVPREQPTRTATDSM